MAVIDLSTRITNDWATYHQNKRSSDSYIYILPTSYGLDDGPASVDFTVGEKWFIQNDNTAYEVTSEGIILAPFQSILVETAEEVALPFNVFGLVTGKGLQIFQGTFISTGKINPGFCDKLKIGIYNGGKKKITLMKGSSLCTCVFFAMESNLRTPLKAKPDSSVRAMRPIGRLKKISLWLKENKELLAIIISILALIASLSNVLLNKNFILYPNVVK